MGGWVGHVNKVITVLVGVVPGFPQKMITQGKCKVGKIPGGKFPGFLTRCSFSEISLAINAHGCGAFPGLLDLITNGGRVNFIRICRGYRCPYHKVIRNSYLNIVI